MEKKKSKKSVIWEDGKPNKYYQNWLCPNCLSRPAGCMTKVKDRKHYCIYCDTELIFDNYKEEK